MNFVINLCYYNNIGHSQILNKLVPFRGDGRHEKGGT